jgi:hypothetical protein
MSAETELARFDTRTRRAAQNDESSEQTDFRTIGAREQGQLALNEIEIRATCPEQRASSDTPVTASEPTRADLEAALGCARATIDGLREQVEALEAERDRLREEAETETEAER